MCPERLLNLVATSCLAALLLALAGCGGTRYPSATVSGRVTIDGAAVPEGFITFAPAAGASGPAVGAEIRNGDYRCERVPQGKARATFVAQAAEPMTIFHKADKAPHEVPKDILPPAYRQGVVVEVGPGENRVDFPLKNGH
jgi:hypothetical protein